MILGAGATGGFFGGNLAAAGRDVSFLVRPARLDRLKRDGIKIESGGACETVPVRAIAAAEIAEPFDVVIISAKAYDLNAAIAAIAPAVGVSTLIIPLLNGMRHLDALDTAFGREHVLGGTCHISVTLGPDGAIRHLSPFASLTLGARSPSQRDAAAVIHNELQCGRFDARNAEDVIAAMWEKWVLLATLAGTTCLMRASIGEIVATGAGANFISRMLDECAAVASACGYPGESRALQKARTVLTDPDSQMSASMRRDVEAGHRVEADHILGDLVQRGEAVGVATPLLRLVYTQLEAYQRRLAA